MEACVDCFVAFPDIDNAMDGAQIVSIHSEPRNASEIKSMGSYDSHIKRVDRVISGLIVRADPASVVIRVIMILNPIKVTKSRTTCAK